MLIQLWSATPGKQSTYNVIQYKYPYVQNPSRKGQIRSANRHGHPNEAEIGSLNRPRRHIFGETSRGLGRFQVHSRQFIWIKITRSPVAGKLVVDLHWGDSLRHWTLWGVQCQNDVGKILARTFRTASFCATNHGLGGTKAEKSQQFSTETSASRSKVNSTIYIAGAWE